MNKRILKFIFLLLSAAVLMVMILYPLWGHKDSLRYDKLIISSQELESIMSVRQSDKSVMTDIFFDDQKLIYPALPQNYTKALV